LPTHSTLGAGWDPWLTPTRLPLPSPPPAQRYHKPRNSYKSLRSETGARHNAFSRGSAYLERYCMMIALAGYFDECGLGSATTFRQWLANRWGAAAGGLGWGGGAEGGLGLL
jgi:hypothetical protein